MVGKRRNPINDFITAASGLADSFGQFLARPSYSGIYHRRKFREKAQKGDEPSQLLFTAYMLMKGFHADTRRRKNGDRHDVHTLHVGNVMLKYYGLWGGIIGFLHDVLEDNPELKPEELQKFGFPDFVINALKTLTRREGELYADYIDHIASSPPAPDGINYAIKTKLADLAHNLASDEELKKTRLLTPDEISKNYLYRLAEQYLKAIEQKAVLQPAYTDGSTHKVKITGETGIRFFAVCLYGFKSNELENVRLHLGRHIPPEHLEMLDL